MLELLAVLVFPFQVTSCHIRHWPREARCVYGARTAETPHPILPACLVKVDGHWVDERSQQL